MIQVETTTVSLSDGREIIITENDFDMSRKLNRLTEEAKQSVNGGTSALDFFRKDLYPVLAAPASGEVPDAFAAFSLPRADLDKWYMAVWKLNGAWFTKEYPEDPPAEKIVTFRDGSTLTVIEARGLPSFVIRLAELEDEAVTNPSGDAGTQLFNLVFYPKMAASVIGDVPSKEVMRKWPTAETNKLYEAAAEVNPDWFKGLSDLSEEARKSVEAKEKEEKKRKAMKQAG